MQVQKTKSIPFTGMLITFFEHAQVELNTMLQSRQFKNLAQKGHHQLRYRCLPNANGELTTRSFM